MKELARDHRKEILPCQCLALQWQRTFRFPRHFIGPCFMHLNRNQWSARWFDSFPYQRISRSYRINGYDQTWTRSHMGILSAGCLAWQYISSDYDHTSNNQTESNRVHISRAPPQTGFASTPGNKRGISRIENEARAAIQTVSSNIVWRWEKPDVVDMVTINKLPWQRERSWWTQPRFEYDLHTRSRARSGW